MSSALPVWLQPANDRLMLAYRAERLPHAVLIIGRVGDGLHHFGQRLSHQLLCTAATDRPCGQCRACQLVAAGSHPDQRVIEPEGKSETIKVDAIRDIANFMHETAQQGGNKVIRLTRADRMNNNAANALLKMLEEPTANTFLLLETESLSRLLPTVRSRCRLLRLDRPTLEQAQQYLDQHNVTERVEDRLALTAGAPLAAVELTDDTLSAWQERVERFRQERGFSDLAAFIAQQDSDALLTQLMIWIDSAVHQQFHTNTPISNLDAPVVTPLSGLPSTQLFAFRDLIIRLKESLAGQANLNAQLWSEQLASRWLELTSR
ncbi:DNA polymerase III subunit delta' [Saccharospirillum sp. MSK14-1]|uniref:DNA polymerase III subunit delta' n=1 Tax=Saccharospirillum sp. MSK14-1 TaxID=1897632 RepID=UPI000D3B960E|nr:DNA polymerase III subunit delta' [Saccharospirillum sp. MSK14-1]PTY36627.1 DNA polymerase III subunit delta' [Saccharospirillum sp. MSK14-1]